MKKNIYMPNSKSVFAILNQLANVEEFKTDCEFISSDYVDAVYYPAGDESDEHHNIVIFFEYRLVNNWSGFGYYRVTIKNQNTGFTVEICNNKGNVSDTTEFLANNDAAEIKAKLAI